MFALSAPLPTFPGAAAPQGAASEAAVAADPFAALLAMFDSEGGAGQDGFQEDAQDPAAATPDTVLTAAATAPLPPAPILLSLAVTSEAEPGAGSPASASAMPEAFVAKAPQATPLVTPAPASAPPSAEAAPVDSAALAEPKALSASTPPATPSASKPSDTPAAAAPTPAPLSSEAAALEGRSPRFDPAPQAQASRPRPEELPSPQRHISVQPPAQAAPTSVHPAPGKANEAPQTQAAPAPASPPAASAPEPDAPAPSPSPRTPPPPQAVATPATPAAPAAPPVQLPTVAAEARRLVSEAADPKTAAKPVTKSRDDAEGEDTPAAPPTVAATSPANGAKPAAAATPPVPPVPASMDDAAGEAAPDAAHEPAQVEPAPSGRSEASAAPQSPAPAAVRGSPETVAHLAAQIVKKLEGQSSRFEIELTPAGLGKVEVRMEVSAHGHVAASLSFDNPQAAADMRARAAELQRTLEQAGFTLSGGLSFDVAGDQRQAPQQQDGQAANAGAAHRGRAFQAALDAIDAPPSVPTLRSWSRTGVDIRI